MSEHDAAAPFSLSVVLPVYNEQENILELYHRLTEALTIVGYHYELIFIDDGSRDNTRSLVQKLVQQDRRVRLLGFARNFGHQLAVSAGLNFTSGQAVVVMDADLQDPPELLPQLVNHWQKGYKVVYAQRSQREKESLSKKLFAFIYYRLLNRLAEVNIPVDTGDFCLMDRQVVNLLNLMPERNRYIRGLRSWVGFKQTSILFERPQRAAGEPKYSFSKSLALAIDGLVSFSKVPLRLATWLGFISGILSVLMAGLVIYWRFFTRSPLAGYAMILVSIFFLGAVQLITVGILGEYIGRIYEEVKNRPLYILEQVEGFSEATPYNLTYGQPGLIRIPPQL